MRRLRGFEANISKNLLRRACGDGVYRECGVGMWAHGIPYNLKPLKYPEGSSEHTCCRVNPPDFPRGGDWTDGGRLLGRAFLAW